MAEVPADSLWGHTEDDGEWQSSKIKGFTFEDDDEVSPQSRRAIITPAAVDYT
jgi:hypothetical protein